MSDHKDQTEKAQRSHPRCERPNGHTCQQPSGRVCIVGGCGGEAGTDWGPFWCPEHDAERLDRISEGFAEVQRQMSLPPGQAREHAMTAPMTCADCNQPSTHDAYAGYVCVGGVWIQQTRPLCDSCGWTGALERAEKRSA